MTRLGIVAALPAEAGCLAGRRPVPGQLLALRSGGLLKPSGIGPARAHRAACELLEAGATALLSWGTAGGLDPGLGPGSLVLPRTVIGPDGAAVAVAAAWHERVRGALAPYLDLHTGTMVESPGAVADPAAKEALFRRTGALAVDMESAAIGTVARQAGVPFLVIRAVADPAGQALSGLALAAIDGAGRVNWPRLLRGLASRPADALALLRLARDFRAARRSLTEVARRLGVDGLGPGAD